MRTKKSVIHQRLLCAALLGVLATAVWGQELSTEASPEESGKKNGLANFLAKNMETLLKANNIFFPSGKPAGAEIPAATAGQPAAATEQLFTLNFNNAGIDVVLKFLSDMTGKVLMRDDAVQGQITLMVPEKITKERAVGYIEQALALKRFTLLETDNILIVLPMSLAKQYGLEVGTGEAEGPLSPRMRTQMISLKFASAVQLKEDLQPLLSENGTMIADSRTNSLVITESGTNIARLSKIIAELDRADEGSNLVVRIFELRYTSAETLAKALDEMMIHLNAKPGAKSTKEGAGAPASSTKILPDPDTNCLIVSGTEKEVALVKSFVETLDASGAARLETTTIKLQQADARTLAEQISQIFRQRKSKLQQAVVAADTWTNSLIVSGYPEDLETVKRLVRELDERKSAKKETRVYVLKEADATVLSEILSTVLTAGQGSSSGERGYFPPFGRGQRGGGGSEQEEQPRITVDTRLNGLVITAKVEDFQMIEELLKQLDVALPESKEEPRVFPLKYADARDVAQILNDLFSDRESTFGFFFMMSQTRSISGLSGKVKVIADPTTNSLVVIASSPRGFEVVQKLLEQLDQISPEFGSTMVIPLQHANAEDLATGLTSLFEEDPRRRAGGAGMLAFFGGGSSQTQQREISNLMGNVRVVADARTNSLMVSTPQQNMETIREIIRQLDRPTSQVLVEILIVELTSDSDRNLGIQWAGEDGSVRGTASFAFQTPFLTQEQRDTGRTFRSTTLSSSQFDAVLNILAKSTNTNVVARPNILTANNKEATVNVGKDIQYYNQIQATETGELASTEFRPVGLTLTVKPQVNESTLHDATGVVTLEITVTTGDQALDVVGLPAGLQAFTKREIKTNVTVENGMTVVLSGVIDENWTDSTQGVPGLSKIPLLGNIFKNKRKIQQKTELITFITPEILDTRQQIQEVTERHMQTDSYRYWLNRQKEMELEGEAARKMK
jgi:type II secretion system protein D